LQPDNVEKKAQEIKKIAEKDFFSSVVYVFNFFLFLPTPQAVLFWFSHQWSLLFRFLFFWSHALGCSLLAVIKKLLQEGILL